MPQDFVRLDFDRQRLAEAGDAPTRAILNAANGAMRDEGAIIKAQLRSDVLAGIPNGAKLANTWRVTPQPRNGRAYDPALWIVNNAGEIISAFSEGATITAGGGRWLAIPAPEYLKVYRRMQPKSLDGRFQERGSWPEAIARSLGGRPEYFIEKDGQRGFVYVQLGKRRQIIGWLERQSVLGRRMRGPELLREIAARLPETYGALFLEYLDAELKAENR